MTNQPRPLDAFPLVRTRNIGELEDSLGRIFAKPVLDLVDHAKPLDAVQNFCQLQNIAINYGAYGTGIRFRFPAPSVIAQIFPLKGHAEVLIHGKSIAADGGRSTVLSGDFSFTMSSSADYERLNLSIDPKALTRLLASITGEPIPSTLKIDAAPDTTPAANSFRDHLIFLTHQISASRLPPALLMAEFEQALMVMFLHTNKHNYSHLLERKPADLASRQVRQAEAYIEANWNSPMNLVALASEIGVSIRGLFETFRRIRGYSPTEFLRRMRLHHARRMLHRPEFSTTMATVAFACGYGDIGRFRRDYLGAYGEEPAQTLARSMGSGVTWH